VRAPVPPSRVTNPNRRNERELWKDVFISVNMFDTFDSRRASEGADRTGQFGSRLRILNSGGCLNKMAVSDPARLEGLTQFRFSSRRACLQTIGPTGHGESDA
jgi:hypothetical protein